MKRYLSLVAVALTLVLADLAQAGGVNVQLDFGRRFFRRSREAVIIVQQPQQFYLPPQQLGFVQGGYGQQLNVLPLGVGYASPPAAIVLPVRSRVCH